MTNPLLKISGLTVTYGTDMRAQDVVRDVDLSVNPGEVVGLVGESGSGKSTVAKSVLRILGGSARIAAREMTFDGFNILTADDASLQSLRWKQVSFVPQSALNALNPLRTIGGHFQETLLTHGVSDPAECLNRSKQALVDVSLESDLLTAYPHQLSGGMRQRVAIALALLLRPKLVIMDEPTTALDVLVQRHVINEVIRLQQELGFAILFITHDLSLLFEIADRVAVMCNGEIVETAPVATLLRQPQHPYSKHLLNCRTQMPDEVAQ